jgi:hypothetical protein
MPEGCEKKLFSFTLGLNGTPAVDIWAIMKFEFWRL